VNPMHTNMISLGAERKQKPPVMVGILFAVGGKGEGLRPETPFIYNKKSQKPGALPLQEPMIVGNLSGANCTKKKRKEQGSQGRRPTERGRM